MAAERREDTARRLREDAARRRRETAERKRRETAERLRRETERQRADARGNQAWNDTDAELRAIRDQAQRADPAAAMRQKYEKKFNNFDKKMKDARVELTKYDWRTKGNEPGSRWTKAFPNDPNSRNQRTNHGDNYNLNVHDIGCNVEGNHAVEY